MADIVEVIIKGTDKLSATVGTVVGSLGKLGLVAGGAVLSGLTALGGAAFAAGMQMDQAFDTIRIKTGETGESLGTLQNDFKAVFTSIPTDVTSASNVISGLSSRLNISGEALQNLATPLLEATRLMGGDATQNTQLFTRVMGDWGVSVEQGAGTLDKFFKASQVTGTGMETLMAQAVQFGSPMRLMGFSLDQTIALFGQFAAQGVNSELVMGSLRIAAGKFAKENIPLQEGLVGTFESIKNNTDASAALSTAMEIFGARAGPDMAAAIREGRFSIDDLVATIQGSQGAITSAAADTMDFGEKFTILKNKITVGLEPLGSAMMGVASTIADALLPALTTLMPSIVSIAEKAGVLLTTLITAGPTSKEFGVALTAAFGPKVSAVIQTVVGVIGEVVTVLGAIITKVGEVVAAFQTGGLQGALTAAFGPEITGMVMKVVNAFTSVATTLSNSLMPVIKLVVGVFKGDLPAATQTLSSVWTGTLKPAIDKIVEIFGDLMRQVIPFLIEQFRKISSWITENRPLIEAFANTLREKFAKAMELIAPIAVALANAISGMWTFVKPILTALVDFVLGMAKTIMQMATGDWAGAWKTIQDTATKIWENVKRALVGFIDWILGLFGTDLATIKADWDAWWNSLHDFVVSIVPNMITAGQALIDGIRSGISEKWEEMKSWFLKKVRALPDAVKKLLGIGSPSKVFEEIGKAISDGLKEGIESTINESIKVLEDKLGDMADQIGKLQNKLRKAVKTGNKDGIKELRAQIAALKKEYKAMAQELADAMEGLSYGLAAGLLKAVGSLGSLGSAVADRITRYTLDPLQARLELITEGNIGRIAELQEALSSVGGIDWSDLGDTLSNSEISRFRQIATALGNSEALRILDGIVASQQERNALETEYAQQQQDILELQRRQEEMSFLQAQLDFLEMLRENGLNAAEILKGVTLGINADLPGLLDAMNAAMYQMVVQAEEALGVASPSKVFAGIGRQLMQGLGVGILGSAQVATSAATRVSQQVAQAGSVTQSKSWILNIQTNARLEPILADFYGMKSRSRI